MNPTLMQILAALEEVHADPIIFGGSVRDLLLDLPFNDIDVEVYNISAEPLAAILEQFGRVDRVGMHFGVLKLHTGGESYDFSIPRRESKSGSGHKGFIPEFDPTITIEEASARRDFTINSMGMRSDGAIIDYHGGRADLGARTLRHVSDAFVDDTLRVLRGVQLAGRYELWLNNATAYLCSTMRDEYHTLPKERIWPEWNKLALKSTKPSMGLDVLELTRWIELYPELSQISGYPQDPEWHPEGCVWTHTKNAVDHSALVATRDNLSDEDRLVLFFAVLCHDMAKPRTTTFDDDGHIRSKGHAEEGIVEARSFLNSIGAPSDLISQVVPLVQQHLRHIQIKEGCSNRTINRLARDLYPATVAQWARVVECDHSGRPPLPTGAPADWIVERAKDLKVLNDKPAEILMGRHLIDLGLKPGREFGVILQKAYDAQLDDQFNDVEGALKWFEVQRTAPYFQN